MPKRCCKYKIPNNSSSSFDNLFRYSVSFYQGNEKLTEMFKFITFKHRKCQLSYSLNTERSQNAGRDKTFFRSTTQTGNHKRALRLKFAALYLAHRNGTDGWWPLGLD